MDTANLAVEDQQALRSAMEYWAARWDWECPTLFGIELDELKRIIEHWPRVGRDDESHAELATIGALRELLYGASSRPKDAIETFIGISHKKAVALLAFLIEG
ncbi:MAG TPA: hypothetical protein VF861_02455 [Telluria sp.]